MKQIWNLNTALAMVATIASFLWARFLGLGDIFSPFLPMAIAMGYLGGREKPWVPYLPMLALFVGDCVMGFHSTMLVTYPLTYFAIAMGQGSRGSTPMAFFLKGYSALFLYDFVANSLVWYVGCGEKSWYPATPAGYLSCLAAGVPFHLAKLYAWVVISGVILVAQQHRMRRPQLA